MQPCATWGECTALAAVLLHIITWHWKFQKKQERNVITAKCTDLPWPIQVTPSEAVQSGSLPGAAEEQSGQMLQSSMDTAGAQAIAAAPGAQLSPAEVAQGGTARTAEMPLGKACACCIVLGTTLRVSWMQPSSP